MTAHKLHGGIDAGGTTFKCGLADRTGALIETRRIPVSTPDETISVCLDWVMAAAANATLKSFGIASFGPIDVDPQSESYGTITGSAKPDWSCLLYTSDAADE